MSKIEDSLRALVREELDGRKPPPPPDRKLFFWLFLCVTNVAMLIWLLPETVFDSKRVEAASKFVVWLGASIFVSCFVWFRDQLLGVAQKPFFRRVQIAAFPVLILLYLSQLNIFTIHPVIEPKDAELLLNGQSVSEYEREALTLSLNEHKISLQPIVWNPNDPHQYPRPRQFTLTRSKVLAAWWGSERPRWSLIYNVYVEVAGTVDELVVQSLDRDFDAAFMQMPDPPLPDDVPKALGVRSVTERELLYKWQAIPDTTLPLRLPYGKYAIFTRKSGCDKKNTAIVEVPTPNKDPIELKEPCAE